MKIERDFTRLLELDADINVLNNRLAGKLSPTVRQGLEFLRDILEDAYDKAIENTYTDVE